MLQHYWLDAALVGLMVIGIVGTLYHRIRMEFGIGDRAIQLVGLCLIIPAVLILSLESKIQGETLGTIFGAIIGYALSGIGNPDQRKRQGKDANGGGTPNTYAPAPQPDADYQKISN
jgi:hypothetical protein